jgi:hypothetical protein
MRIQGILLLTLCLAAPVHAETFVAKGTKGTLDVVYFYDAVGKGGTADNNSEWKVSRVVNLNVQLSADAPAPLPGLHTMNAAEQAELASKSASATKSAQSAEQKMAPMMADIESIMAKCGEDEACIEEAVTGYGKSMEMTPELQSAQQDVADAVKASEPGALRYQIWRPTAQTGTYSIDETVKVLHRDPICMELANASATCTILTTRKGEGSIRPPQDSSLSGGLSGVETDAQKKTLAIQLPLPTGVVSYKQTIVTDEPGQKSGTTTQSMMWPQQDMDHKQIADAVNGVIVVALKGNGRDQSGEKVVKLSGEAEESGTLKIRWHFKAL